MFQRYTDELFEGNYFWKFMKINFKYKTKKH